METKLVHAGDRIVMSPVCPFCFVPVGECVAYAWWVQPHHTVFKTLGMHRAPALRSGPSKCCGLALPDTWSVAWAPKVRECRSSLSTALIRICLVPSHTSPPLQCPRHRTVPPRTEQSIAAETDAVALIFAITACGSPHPSPVAWRVVAGSQTRH